MHAAVAGDDAKAVRRILERRASPDTMQNTVTPLMVAASIGSLRCASLLCEAGASVNMQRPSPEGGTALHAACQYGHEPLVALLLSHRADVMLSMGEIGGTPLHVACEMGHASCIRALLGASIDAHVLLTSARATGEVPLSLAARSDAVDAVDACLAAGARVNYALRDGATALLIAVESGALRCAKRLLEAGASTEAVCGGKTALHEALCPTDPAHAPALAVRRAAVGLLLEAKAESGRAWRGRTPLQLADALGDAGVHHLLATAAAASPPALTWQRVRIHGLQRAAAHNGKLGCVLEIAKEGRLAVALAGGKRLAVRAENAEPLPTVAIGVVLLGAHTALGRRL
jgi:ankyrin repeat protein